MQANQPKIPFYKKSWFMWLMLIFLYPIGVILLWLYGKQKQATKIVLTVAFGIFFLIVVPKGNGNSKTALSSSVSPAPSQSILLQASPSPIPTAVATMTDSPTTEPTATPEPTKQALNLVNLKVTSENVADAIKPLFNAGEFRSVDITKEKGKTIVDVYFKPSEFWDEKDFARQVGYQATIVMQALFTSPKIDKVWVWGVTDMTDAKANSTEENVMNVCLTKENASDINWEKFKQNAYVYYKTLLIIADSYYIHPGIKKYLDLP